MKLYPVGRLPRPLAWDNALPIDLDDSNGNRTRNVVSQYVVSGIK
jgi:hypothetical protein